MNQKLNNCNSASHQLEEIKINDKIIYQTLKNSSYQIKKTVDGNKITYKITN